MYSTKRLMVHFDAARFGLTSIKTLTFGHSECQTSWEVVAHGFKSQSSGGKGSRISEFEATLITKVIEKPYPQKLNKNRKSSSR